MPFENVFSFCTFFFSIPWTSSVVNQNIKWSKMRAHWRPGAVAQGSGEDSTFTVPNSQFVCCNTALKHPEALQSHSPPTTVSTLNNGLITCSLTSSKILSTCKVCWGSHGDQKNILICYTHYCYINIYFLFCESNFYHYDDSKLLLGKPNRNSVCCTCVLGVFTPRGRCWNFIINVQRRNRW